jgi:hypothetical protein
MTTAKPLARYSAIWGARSRAASLPPSYTTSWDLTECPKPAWRKSRAQAEHWLFDK